MCGGDFEVNTESNILECEYCGTKQTIPNVDNEKKVNLFNRANRLRINCEFDKAATIYENIISEFPEEAEAYWGLCLSNYGIEYVDDPATAKKIPTCHRASFESLQKDENYALALEYSDVMAQKVYRDEAREIDRIMNEILAVSKSEKPYDIFICYKETDERGNRTVDSVLAYDIYEALTAKGYNVFFSRVTLEDKLGRQYEPYIFAALNSAKVMLSIGTKYEYFNAVWVKNEWSRFLKLMAKDRTKLLIPCYKDMDPYDMPDEFKGLQAQDMGKLGAMQDLLRGVEKILPKNNSVQTAKETVVVQQSSGNATVDSLLKRAFMFLEDGEWERADDFCEQVLNIDPECADAYLGKLMADLKVKNQDNLKNQENPFYGNNYYQKAVRFGDDKLVSKLKADIEYINKHNENERLEKIYNEAYKLYSSKTTEDELKRASSLFAGISQYKDAEKLSKECLEKAVKLKEIKEHNSKRLKKRIIILSSVVVVIIALIITSSKVSLFLRYKPLTDALRSTPVDTEYIEKHYDGYKYQYSGGYDDGLYTYRYNEDVLKVFAKELERCHKGNDLKQALDIMQAMGESGYEFNHILWFNNEGDKTVLSPNIICKDTFIDWIYEETVSNGTKVGAIKTDSYDRNVLTDHAHDFSENVSESYEVYDFTLSFYVEDSDVFCLYLFMPDYEFGHWLRVQSYLENNGGIMVD